MLAQAHSLQDGSPEIRPGQSSCSSDTGDVLVRSTRVHQCDRREEPEPGPRAVQISVQKLQDPLPVQSLSKQSENQQRLKQRQRSDKGAHVQAAADPQPRADLLTSRFTAGGRGLVLAALKQRCHSVPHRREVKVHLLDPNMQDDAGLRTSSQNAAGLTSGAAATQVQSDMEARVSQLMDGVEKLLQSDREAGDSRRDLNQQTLQHLERLHSQQLQLQSQLLESALGVVTGHASLRAGHRLHVTDLDTAAENLLISKKTTSSATRDASATATEMGTVAMVTPQGSGRTEQTRQNWSKPDGPSVPKAAAHKPGRAHLQSAASDGPEVPRERGRLTTEDSVRTTAPPPPENLWSQQNYSHPNQNQSCHSVFHKSQMCQNPILIQPQLHHYHHDQAQPSQSQSVPVQRRPVVPSMLEEAGQVLRQVQRQKKVLEENLEALLRAQRGELLHCQLEALAADRDWTNKVRIKKTVDAWIDSLSRDMQTDITSQQGAAEGSATHSARRRPASTATGSKTVLGRGGRAQTAGRQIVRRDPSQHITVVVPPITAEQVQGAEPGRVTGVTDNGGLDGQSYLTRLYGRAPYEGARRTLKKSPYLRFRSPASPFASKARPRLVESVRGVKVKSCKTQTTSDHTDVQPVPVAVPLGRPRVASSSRRQQEVTSPCHAPPSASVVSMDNGSPEPQSQSDAGESPPSHPLIIERKSEEEDDDVFPGDNAVSVAGVVQLDPAPPPPPVQYWGPSFPPQPTPTLPAQDTMLGLDQQRDILENRLVEWVEQELMSRMISEMYRPTASDPAQNVSSDHLEPEERSITSDTVEAAGGAGLQLFVDSNTEVDSALIRHLVSEVLTETVSLLLGQRDSLCTEPEPVAAAENVVPLVPTPVPTPPPSPRETTPLTTPPPISQIDESPEPVTAHEHIATPTSSPEPAPSAELHPAPLTWRDAELPLDEEHPEAPLDSHSPPLLMPVAEEEPPISSPPPPLPSVPPVASSPPPDSGPPSMSSSSDDSSSSSSSSAVTEAALKHISEGELLLSLNLQAALTEHDTACSFSSSPQDMDLDPPSEGQVRHQDLLLLTKMEQRGERPQPEGSWGREEEVSVGEVRDNWTTEPSRTTHPSQSTSAQQDQPVSPGQISQCPEVSFEATNQGLVSLGDLTVEPLGMLTSDLQTEPPPHLQNTHTTAQVVPIQVKQFSRHKELDLQPRGTRKMDVHLPFIGTEQEEEMEELLSAAETDSSTNDVF